MDITSYDTPLKTMRDLSKKLEIPLRMQKNKRRPTHYFVLTFDIGKLEISIFSEDYPNEAEVLVGSSKGGKSNASRT